MRPSYRVLALVLFAAACETPTRPGPATESPPGQRLPDLTRQNPDTALLQTRIVRLMADRTARGLPTPVLSLEFRSQQGSSLAEVRNKVYAPGEGYSYTAKTVVYYRGPADAGLERWPAMTVRPEQSQKLGITSAELQARYVARREAASPGFWQRHRLGYEPRTYTVVESQTLTYPRRLDVQPAGARVSEQFGLSALQSAQTNLLFGFSFFIPSIGDTWSFGFEDVETLDLSFSLDFGIGLRLPMLAELESPEPMDEGSTYSGTSSVTGQNWNGTQYSDVSLPAEDGHEAYFKLTATGCVGLSGVIDSGPHCETVGPSEFTDFVTPLGSGNAVALPQISYPVVDAGVAGVDLVITPSVGSDKLTADWSVGGEATGGGALTFSSSASPVTLADVRAIDGPGTAAYSLTNFQYYFNQFLIAPGVRLWVDVEIPVFPDWEESWSLNLGSFDLGDFIPGLELALPIHGSPYSGPSSLALSVPILNVAPTATMSLTGGQLVVINGIPTVMGTTGEDFTFTGTSHDPGRDDLTLSWDWGDGPPAPDVSTLYPLGAPMGPNDAQDVQTHAFSRSCMYEVKFRSVDDDAAFAEAGASILVTETGNPSRLEGYWQKQLGRTGGNLLDAEVVNCYLRIVDRVSRIFSEVRAAATMPEAFVVVNVSQNSGSELEQLDREILVVWLNFAAGAIGYDQLVDTDDDGIADTPFVQVMQTAETVRLDPTSTVTALRVQTERLHQISQQFTKSNLP